MNNTNLNNWFKVKNYPHIGLPLNKWDEKKLSEYISNPEKIKKHSFLPFIHRKVKTRKFRKSYTDDGNVIKDKNKAKRTKSVKIRDIYYASHLDSNIFSFYADKLNSFYENKLKESNLDDVVTAYRKIPLINTKRNKCNVDFAKEVFEFIQEYLNSSSELVAITFDIESFFDNLNHKLIKDSWCEIINQDRLPDDQYNVFYNITRFSYVNEIELFEEFKNEIIVDLNPIKKKKISKIKYLREQKAISFCELKDFKKRVLEKKYIKSNKYVLDKEKYVVDKGKKKLKLKGIPQGSSISSVLANIYLFNFDKEVNKYIKSINGLYRRYSDDIVVICSPSDKEKTMKLFYEKIQNYKLKIQSTKTQTFYFQKNNSIIFKNESKNGNYHNKKRFGYLGFEFDGNCVYLKSSGLAKFYRSLKRTLKRGSFFAKHTKCKDSKGEIFIRRLYKRFSYKGAKRKEIINRDKNNISIWNKTNRYDWGNYLTYAKLAHRNMINNKIKSQIRKHWKILNESIKEEKSKI